MTGFIDANGSEIVTTSGAVVAGASSSSLSGSSAATVSSTVAVSRRIDAATRRRVQTILVYEKAAVNVPSTFDPSPAFNVTDYAEALIYALVFNGAGSPAGVTVTVQAGDAVNGLWVAHPQGVLSVVGAAGPNAIFAMGALTVLGDVLRAGILATTPWTGGTVQLWAKLKG